MPSCNGTSATPSTRRASRPGDFVIGLCSGQGRDVIDVVANHPRRTDVTARLVEAGARLVADARDLAEQVGVGGIELVCGLVRRAGFAEVAFDAEPGAMFGVGTRRFTGPSPGLAARPALVRLRRRRRRRPGN